MRKSVYLRPGAYITVTEGMGVWHWSTTVYGSERDCYYHGHTNTRWGAKRQARRAARRHYK